MAALTAGTEAPEFTLPTTEGQIFSLSQALKTGPVVLAFLKTNCPTCRYAFPFLERLHAAYRERGVTVLGVSQSSEQDTARFRKEYGVSLAAVLDDPRGYRISKAYGITNTPTVFLIAASGTIAVAGAGWSRADLDEINAKIAASLSSPEVPLFHAGEQVAEWKPG
jgi:peroxiredoxin